MLRQEYDRSLRAFEAAWRGSEAAEQAFNPYSEIHLQYISAHQVLQQAWRTYEEARGALYPDDEEVPGTPQRVSQARTITQLGRPFRPIFD